MQKSKSKNTKPELLVRKALSAWGFRYRIHYKKLVGTPDIAFPKEKIAVFVHGCFWHQHGNCGFSKPASIPKGWRDQFIKSNKRDIDNLRTLKQIGWTPFVLWECRILESVKEEIEPVIVAVERARIKNRASNR